MDKNLIQERINSLEEAIQNDAFTPFGLFEAEEAIKKLKKIISEKRPIYITESSDEDALIN